MSRVEELKGRWLDSGDLGAHVAWLRARFEAHERTPLNDYREHLDELTGVHRKAFVEERLQAAMQLGEDVPVGVILLDVDWLMKVNDRFGHGLADAVLSRLGGLLPACVRSSVDTIGRWGGDEFLIVLIDALPPLLESTAARVRELVAEDVATEEIPVTVSMGMACTPVESDREFEHVLLLRAADEALYAAKSAGRDRWAWGPGA